MSFPNPLQQGDKVAIVATAKRIEFQLGPALDRIKSWGLVPVLGKCVENQFGYFAGTDQEKLEDLNWALTEKEIKAIIFLRGGYGTTRIIDRLDLTKVKKWLVGYSDLTSMILALAKRSIPMVHGPMCSTLGQDDVSDEMLKLLLFGQRIFEYPLSNNHSTVPAQFNAQIVGGNLSLLYESIGANNEIDLSNKVLFLEEVGEQMYAIDRMLNKLKRIGKLDRVKGLIIGSFSSIGNSNDYFTQSVEELICQYFPKDMPKAIGLSSGHERTNYPILMSTDTNIKIDQESIRIEYL